MARSSLASPTPADAAAGIYRTATAAAQNRVFIVGSAAGTGTITVKGGGELTLADSTNNAGLSGFAATNNNLQINSVIADDGANPVSVNILGYAILAANNTFTGGLTIQQGRAQVGATAPSATASGLGPTGGTVTVLQGGQAFLNANGDWNHNWVLNGVGTSENNGLGAIRAATGRNVLGTITLASDAALSGQNGSPNYKANITGPGALIIGHGNNNNGSGSPIFGDGSGTQTYTYQGDTIINQSTVQQNTFAILAGSNNLLPSGANRGNFLLNASSAAISATLTLNGTSQNINGLNSSVTSPLNNFVQNGLAATSSKLTLGNNNANGAFGGVIRDQAGTMSIAKTGAGTQTFSGANTYTGTTEINAGTFSLTGAHTGAGNYSIESGATFGGTGSVTFAATGSLTAKSGSVVAPGASIGQLTVDGSVAASPVVNFLSGASLSMELNNAFLSDRVKLSGGSANDIVFGGNVVNFIDLAGGSLATGAYTLFTADVAGAYSGLTADGSGFISAGLTIGSGLGAYPNKSLQVVGNDIVLNIAVPEPAAMLLGALGLVGVALGRRRFATV